MPPLGRFTAGFPLTMVPLPMYGLGKEFRCQTYPHYLEFAVHRGQYQHPISPISLSKSPLLFVPRARGPPCPGPHTPAPLTSKAFRVLLLLLAAMPHAALGIARC